MRQAVTTKVGEINFRDVGEPIVGSNQVLLEMQYVGICGSDIHIFHGKHPFVPPSLFPLVQGHEGVGKIVKLGEDVKNFKIGDIVVVEPQIFCGICYQCKKGDYHICQELKVIGCQCDGMFSQYFAIDSSKICEVNNIPLKNAAMIEPLAVAVRAVRRASDVKAKNVLVIGAGTIGNLVAQTARAFGAHQVGIVDMLQDRLDLASSKCKIDYAWNLKSDDIKANVHTYFGSYGADIIFECVGVESSFETAIQLSGKGMEIILVGVFGQKTSISASLIQDKEINIKGILMYKHEDYEAAIDLVKRQLVNLDALIYKEIPFEEYPHAYTLIDENKDRALKVLVKIN